MEKFCGQINSEIAEIIETYEEVLSRFDWLFVCIDSSRGKDLTSKREFYDQYCIAKKIKLSWTPVGFVIPKSSILSVAQIEEKPLIENFSAAYLFDDASNLDRWPQFSGTGDEWNFDNAISSQLVNEVYGYDASAYFSDGAGVNYFFNNRALVKALDARGFFDL